MWKVLAFHLVVCGATLAAGLANAQGYSCSAKYCSSMRDCGEAWYHLTVCGDLERDGDGDGIPCENVCGSTKVIMRQRLQALGIDPDSGGGAAKFVSPATPQPQDFDCSRRKSCKQMISCEEATYQLTVCGNRKLDGNNDGIACNSLCRNR